MPVTISENKLAQFYGSENWYKHWTGRLVYTDGVEYLNANGAGWLVDAVASYQGTDPLKKGGLQDFQLWELKKTGTSAVLTCKADSGKKPVITQEIEFTDFPLDSIKLYVEYGGVGGKPCMVCMLPSER